MYTGNNLHTGTSAHPCTSTILTLKKHNQEQWQREREHIESLFCCRSRKGHWLYTRQILTTIKSQGHSCMFNGMYFTQYLLNVYFVWHGVFRFLYRYLAQGLWELSTVPSKYMYVNIAIMHLLTPVIQSQGYYLFPPPIVVHSYSCWKYESNMYMYPEIFSWHF